MLRFPQNGRRRKNAPAQHTLAACIESPDRCGSAASQRHSFTMPPTAYRPAQDEQSAAQRPLGCWTAAAQIPIHRQIRRADLTLPVKHIKSHLRRPLQYKSLPFLCAKNPRTAYSLPSPDASSLGPPPLPRRAGSSWPGAASGANGDGRSRPDAIPRLSFPNPLYFQPATLCILSAFPDCLFAETSSAGRLRRVASHRHRDPPECRHCSAFRGDLIRIVIVRSYRYGFVPAAIGDVFSIVRLYRFRSPLFALNHAGKAALTV